MRIADLMTRNVRTCTERDSLDRAAQLMWEHDVGCLVVLDAANRPIGMVTDRDLTMAAYTQGVRLRESRVGSAMARHVKLCHAEADSNDVEELMRSSGVRRVPVVGPDGALEGIVTLSDLARTALSSISRERDALAVTKTLAAIAGPRAVSG